MPRGDTTGPMGFGPMTGRGAGYCTGSNMPGFMSQWPRFGRGRGFGRGSGFGRRFGRGLGWRRFAFEAPLYPAPAQPAYPQQPSHPTKEQETQMLEQEAKTIEEEQKVLNDELTEIRKRLDELKTQQ